MHESKRQEGRDTVRRHHKNDAYNLALLPRLDKVGEMQHDLFPQFRAERSTATCMSRSRRSDNDSNSNNGGRRETKLSDNAPTLTPSLSEEETYMKQPRLDDKQSDLQVGAVKEFQSGSSEYVTSRQLSTNNGRMDPRYFDVR